MITDILGVSSPSFSHTLEDYERRTGNNGHSLSLISDIRVRGRHATEALGADYTQTGAKELYFMLQERARQGNIKLSERLGVTADDTPLEVVNNVISWLEAQDIFREVWVVKPALIKAALKNQPPKVLMKTLGLRSVDSMLKRNNPSELLPLAYSLEKPEWSQKIRLGFKKIKPIDFHVIPVSLHVISAERIDKLNGSTFPLSRVVTPCYELGSLLVATPKNRYKGDVLAIATALIESIADIRKHSAYFRTISVRGDFGPRFLEVCEQGIVRASSKLSHVGWGSLNKHLVGNEDFFARVEQPHLTHQDLRVSSAVSVLSAYEPSFEFWDGLEHVFFVSDGERPVSMHLIDVVTNASNQVDYHNSYMGYGQASLWEELWSRYLTNDELAEQISDQFLGNDNL